MVWATSCFESRKLRRVFRVGPHVRVRGRAGMQASLAETKRQWQVGCAGGSSFFLLIRPWQALRSMAGTERKSQKL